MIKIIGILLLVIIAGIIALWSYARYRINHAKDTHNLAEKIDKNCNELIIKNEVTGFAVGVVKGNDHYIKGYGWADKERRIPIDSNTIFEIGSISKVFTTSLTEILAQRNEMDWNVSINKYLPAGLQDEKYNNTTLLHLATHTSGFPRLPEYLLSKMKDDCNPYALLTMDDLCQYLKNPADKKVPDTDNYDYSNIGNGLLAHILEWKTGKSYEKLLEEEITGKLDMHATGLAVKDSSNFAIGYDSQKNKTCHWDLPILYGAGAIRSTMADMVKFAKANLRDTHLSDTFKRTHKQVYKMSGGGIGKGWHIDKEMNILLGIGEVVWHNGGTGGFSSYIGLLPEDNVAVIILANEGEVNDKIEGMVPLLFMAARRTSFK